MNQKQKVRIFSGIFLVATFFSVIPAVPFSNGTVAAQSAPSSALESGGYSGLIPCGRSGNQGEASMPCTACHAVVGAKRLMDYLTGIMVVVAVAVIVAMGVLYILSGVNVDLKKTAKGGIRAVFIGLVLMLSAWLIVSTILRFMASDQFIQGGSTDGKGGFIGLMAGDGTYGLQCSTRSDAGTAELTPGGVVPGAGTYASAGTGTCKAPTTGACSPNALRSTCFGGKNVDTWSAICYKESTGSTTIASKTDICTGDESPVSFGLFQINISANKIGNLDCPKAFSSVFTGSNKNCRVVNRTLYNQCVAAAKDATKNIATACGLAGSNASNTGPWGAARACKIPTKI